MKRVLAITLTIVVLNVCNTVFSKGDKDEVILVNPIIVGFPDSSGTFDCRYINEEVSGLNYLFFEPSYIASFESGSIHPKLREVNSIINLILVDSSKIVDLDYSLFEKGSTIIVGDINKSCEENAKLIWLKIRHSSEPKIEFNPLIHDRIEFLNKPESKTAIIDDSFEPYFSRLQRKEVFTLTEKWPPNKSQVEQLEFVKGLFQQSVLEFSANEKEVIKEMIHEIERCTKKLNLPIYHKTPWRFIKVDNTIAGGFAHTRGTYIIISQQYLDRYIKMERQTDRREEIRLKLIALLFHEKTHVLQRLYPSVFNRLYEDFWGYKKVQMDLTGLAIENQMLNPDSDINPWVYAYKNEFYWINVSLKDSVVEPKMGIDFETKAYKMDKHDGIFTLAQNSQGLLIWKDVSEIETLVNAFPENRGIDSPNEISAYLMGEFICQEIEKQFSLKQDTAAPSKGQIDISLWINDYLTTY